MQRTVRLLLKPSPEQKRVLAETVSEFAKAFNRCVEIGWVQGVRNATSLHYAGRNLAARYRAGVDNAGPGGRGVKGPIAEGVEALGGVHHRAGAEPISKRAALAGGS